VPARNILIRRHTISLYLPRHNIPLLAIDDSFLPWLKSRSSSNHLGFATLSPFTHTCLVKTILYRFTITIFEKALVPDKAFPLNVLGLVDRSNCTIQSPATDAWLYLAAPSSRRARRLCAQLSCSIHVRRGPPRFD
jgi:hypothetical protein